MKEDAEKSKTANLPAQSIKFDGIQDVRLVSDNIEELANKFLDKFKPIIDTTTVQVATPQGVISIPIPSEAIKASGANAGQKFATWLGETFNPVNNKLNQPVVIKQGSANIGNQIAEGAKCKFCDGCFSGIYQLDIDTNQRKNKFESKKNQK